MNTESDVILRIKIFIKGGPLSRLFLDSFCNLGVDLNVMLTLIVQTNSNIVVVWCAGDYFIQVIAFIQSM